jgi:hypothetical protein
MAAPPVGARRRRCGEPRAALLAAHMETLGARKPHAARGKRPRPPGAGAGQAAPGPPGPARRRRPARGRRGAGAGEQRVIGRAPGGAAGRTRWWRARRAPGARLPPSARARARARTAARRSRRRAWRPQVAHAAAPRPLCPQGQVCDVPQGGPREALPRAPVALQVPDALARRVHLQGVLGRPPKGAGRRRMGGCGCRCRGAV